MSDAVQHPSITAFNLAFERMIVNEGGYKLTVVEGDRGGMTFAGISRRANPRWEGWLDIDAGGRPDAQAVRHFYFANYWTPLSLSDVQVPQVATTIFDFAVNAGVGTAAKLAQIVVGATPDGAIGPKTVAALNAFDPKLFSPVFSLAKLARYRDIVTKDRTQLKFLLGWINRLLKEAS